MLVKALGIGEFPSMESDSEKLMVSIKFTWAHSSVYLLQSWNQSLHWTIPSMESIMRKWRSFPMVFAEVIQTTPGVTLVTAEKPGSFVIQMRGHRSLYVECPTSLVINLINHPPCLFVFFVVFFQFLSRLNIVGLKLSIWKVSHCEGHLVKKWEDFSKFCGRKTWNILKIQQDSWW